MSTKVKIGPPRFSETKLFHLEGADKKLVTFDLDGQTVELGEVWKATRTWSPPAAGFGGRIVRLHRQVPCWRNSRLPFRSGFETRADAIRDLYRYWLEES